MATLLKHYDVVIVRGMCEAWSEQGGTRQQWVWNDGWLMRDCHSTAEAQSRLERTSTPSSGITSTLVSPSRIIHTTDRTRSILAKINE